MVNRIKKVLAIEEHQRVWGAQKRFAEKVGAKPGLVGDWLAGRSQPGETYRKKICEIYGINKYWFDTGDGEMEHSTSTEVIESKHIHGSPLEDEMELRLKIARLEGANEVYQKQADQHNREIATALQACTEAVRAAQSHAVAAGKKNISIAAH